MSQSNTIASLKVFMLAGGLAGVNDDLGGLSFDIEEDVGLFDPEGPGDDACTVKLRQPSFHPAHAASWELHVQHKMPHFRRHALLLLWQSLSPDMSQALHDQPAFCSLQRLSNPVLVVPTRQPICSIARALWSRSPVFRRQASPLDNFLPPCLLAAGGKALRLHRHWLSQAGKGPTRTPHRKGSILAPWNPRLLPAVMIWIICHSRSHHRRAARWSSQMKCKAAGLACIWALTSIVKLFSCRVNVVRLTHQTHSRGHRGCRQPFCGRCPEDASA